MLKYVRHSDVSCLSFDLVEESPKEHGQKPVSFPGNLSSSLREQSLLNLLKLLTIFYNGIVNAWILESL